MNIFITWIEGAYTDFYLQNLWHSVHGLLWELDQAHSGGEFPNAENDTLHARGGGGGGGGGGGHSGTEGGRTFVTYFAEEGVFF